MNNVERAKVFFKGAWAMFGNGVEASWKVALAHKRVSAVVVVVVAAALIALPLLFKKPEAARDTTTREVAVARVSDISGAEALSVIATVRSVREANVAANTSGRVAGVYRALGDTVAAGTVIAELENARERAAVAQARAALEKAKSGTAVGTIGVANATESYAAAQKSAEATVASAYATLQDAVTRKSDQLFSNPSGPAPQFVVSVSNSQLKNDAQNKRVSVQPTMTRLIGAVAPTAGSAQLAELDRLLTEAAQVSDFLATVASALQGAIATGSISSADIAQYRADVEGALAAVNALRTTLAATSENLRVKASAVAIAEEGVATGASGKSADIAVAEGALAGALANLEQTIIRAPIGGTINRLDITLGNFLSASVPVVYITNAGGLEAVAYVGSRDLADISLGAKALVGGTVEGVVVKKAQALDPTTKKAEIRISVPSSTSFVSGQSTTVEIERSVKNASATLTIPLSAVKITPDGAVVFTVTEASTLAAHAIALGTLRGGSVEVASGLDPALSIVLDARGLQEGQKVGVRP